MDNSIININPDTLQTSQTTFDGSVAPLSGAGPLQPGQEYAYPGMSPGDINAYLASMNSSQISNIFTQLQAWIEANPTIAVLGGLGILIMAANKSSRR